MRLDFPEEKSVIVKTEQYKLPKLEYRGGKNEQTSMSSGMTASDIPRRRGEGCRGRKSI